MHHLCVYSASQGIGATEADLAAVADPFFARQNSHYLMPYQLKLMMAYGVGTGLDRARLNTPYFRRVFLPYLWPLNQAVNTPTDPAFVDYRDSPLTLPALEEIEVDTTNTDAGAQRHNVALWIGDGDLSYPVGADVYTVRATAAITCVAYTWTSGVLTFGQTLPGGEYAIVGAQVQSATGILARFILPGYAHRPGIIANTSIAHRPPFQGDKRVLGEFGRFKHTALPQLEMFCSGADSAQTVLLDLCKVG